jgi:hypothetical protein
MILGWSSLADVFALAEAAHKCSSAHREAPDGDFALEVVVRQYTVPCHLAEHPPIRYAS